SEHYPLQISFAGPDRNWRYRPTALCRLSSLPVRSHRSTSSRSSDPPSGGPRPSWRASSSCTGGNQKIRELRFSTVKVGSTVRRLPHHYWSIVDDCSLNTI